MLICRILLNLDREKPSLSGFDRAFCSCDGDLNISISGKGRLIWTFVLNEKFLRFLGSERSILECSLCFFSYLLSSYSPIGKIGSFSSILHAEIVMFSSLKSFLLVLVLDLEWLEGVLLLFNSKSGQDGWFFSYSCDCSVKFPRKYYLRRLDWLNLSRKLEVGMSWDIFLSSARWSWVPLCMLGIKLNFLK